MLLNKPFFWFEIFPLLLLFCFFFKSAEAGRDPLSWFLFMYTLIKLIFFFFHFFWLYEPGVKFLVNLNLKGSYAIFNLFDFKKN